MSLCNEGPLGPFGTPWPYLPNVHMNFPRGNVMYRFICFWAVMCFLWGCYSYFCLGQPLPAPLEGLLQSASQFIGCMGDYDFRALPYAFMPKVWGISLVWTSVAKMCALEAREPAAMKIMVFASIFLSFTAYKAVIDTMSAKGEDPAVPANALLTHGDVHVFLDRGSASLLKFG